jgi:hypothetical protein
MSVTHARHQQPARRRAPRAVARLTALALTGTAAGTMLAGVMAVPASADITRCVGAVGVPGAFACYTSPRFNHSGFDNQNVATLPEVCYAVGCTTAQVVVLTPDQANLGTGRFTSVSYLNHTYTVYRPADSQPYILTTDNPHLTPAEPAEVLAISTLLDAANGL